MKTSEMLDIVSKIFEETEYVIENMPSLSLKKLDDLILEVSARTGVNKDETAIFVNWFISKSDDVTLSNLVENKTQTSKTETIKQKVKTKKEKLIKQKLQEERIRQSVMREDRYSRYDGY